MNKHRKKTMATLLIAVFMVSTLAVVYAQPIDEPHLQTTGTVGPTGDGGEARIVIAVTDGLTLGELVSISWEEYLVKGYPPHVDVYLDLGDGLFDSLNFEYALNTETHLGEVPHTGDTAYGALPDAWYATFSDDGNGPATITETSNAWANSGDAGGPGQVLFTLAEWKAGKTYTTNAVQKTISSESIVLRLEIEVDNWIIDTDAYVRNIQVNGAVGLVVEVLQETVGITVSPTSVDFGKLKYGAIVTEEVTITNIGDVAVTITHTIEGDFFIANLDVTDPAEIAPGNPGIADLELTVPSGTPPAIYTGKLVFEATPVYP